MATEVWFRNPHNYIRELKEAGECTVAWDRGLLLKQGINPTQHAELYFGNSFPWRILLIGNQGTAEYTRESPVIPVGVYPTWLYGEDSMLLEDMLANPYGEDVETCSDMTVPADERPVLGQEHRVVISDMPAANTGPGKAFLKYLRELQEEYPSAILHIHGLYSYKSCFGLGFGAADVDPRLPAQKGNVHTPAGSLVRYERVVEKPQWAKAMGMLPEDLAIPRNRCIYNIKSAVWAGQFYTELMRFPIKKDDSETDYESSDEDYEPKQVKSPFIGKVKPTDGDKFVCNTCTLQDKCRYFREGSVCTVPGAEPIKIAHLFKTRDVDQILEGMGTLLAASTTRLEGALLQEQQINEDPESESDGLNPEVTKMIGQVFDQAAKLAKLQDPLRFSPKPGIAINVGQGGAVGIQGGNARQLASQVIQGFLNQGFTREQITPEMVENALAGAANPDAQTKAITGTVIASREEQDR